MNNSRLDRRHGHLTSPRTSTGVRRELAPPEDASARSDVDRHFRCWWVQREGVL